MGVNREPLPRPGEVSEKKWRTNLLYALFCVVPLVAVGILFYLYLLPRLYKTEQFLLFYASLGILGIVLLLALYGYYQALRSAGRPAENGTVSAGAFNFFVKVYVIISLIPLVCVSMLLFLYVIPEFSSRREINLLVVIIAVVTLAFVLSLLGYFLTKRDMVGSIEAIQQSRSKLDRLVGLSTALTGNPHDDIVAGQVVHGAKELLDLPAAYLFAHGEKGWHLREETGPIWKDFDDGQRKALLAILDHVQQERVTRIQPAGFLQPRFAGTGHGPFAILVSPLQVEGDLRGILVLVRAGEGKGLFSTSDVQLVEALAMQSAIGLKNAEFHEIQINYFTHTIELLVMSLEGNVVPRDHLHNVARFSGIMSRRLRIDERERRNIYFAALLHDIGMIKVPSDRHAMPDHYKAHPLLGAEMVGRVTLWKELVPIIRYHHENFDGSGYPEGLKGPEIPLSARIIAIAESFDAMTNPNSYRSLMDQKIAMADLRRLAGIRYDPKLVDIFCEEVPALND